MSLKGKKVVFTGMLSKTRAKMQAEAESAGIDVCAAVSSKTDLLICGVQIVYNATNTKYKKAKEFGVEIIEEVEYRKRLAQTKKVKVPEVSQRLNDFYWSMTKAKLLLLLNQLGEKNIRKSWNKTKLVEQLTQHPIEVVLSLFETDFIRKRLCAYFLSAGGSRENLIYRLTQALTSEDSVFKNNRSKLIQLLKSDDIEVVNSGWLLFETLVSEYSDFLNYFELPDSFDSYLELYRKFSDYPHQDEIILYIIKHLKLYNVPWIETRKRTF